MENKSILIAKVTKARGINGEVKIHSFSHSPNSLEKYDKLYDINNNIFRIKKINFQNKDLFIYFEDIKNRDEAEKLVGTELYIKPYQLDDKEENEFYNYELIDLDILSNDRKTIGKVLAMHNYGAGDIIEIKFEKNTELFAFTNENFPEINLAKKYIIYNI